MIQALRSIIAIEYITPLNLNNKKQKVLIRINQTNGNISLMRLVLGTDLGKIVKYLILEPYRSPLLLLWRYFV